MRKKRAPPCEGVVGRRRPGCSCAKRERADGVVGRYPANAGAAGPGAHSSTIVSASSSRESIGSRSLRVRPTGGDAHGGVHRAFRWGRSCQGGSFPPMVQLREAEMRSRNVPAAGHTAFTMVLTDGRPERLCGWKRRGSCSHVTKEREARRAGSWSFVLRAAWPAPSRDNREVWETLRLGDATPATPPFHRGTCSTWRATIGRPSQLGRARWARGEQ
jgi:hypothetical protein